MLFTKMQKQLLQIPLSLTAVGLGLTTLGTAWGQYGKGLPGISFDGNWVQYLTIGFAVFFLGLSLLKVISNPKWFWQAMKNASASAHLPVLFMLIMAVGEFTIGQTTIYSSFYYFGLTWWWLGLVLQLAYLGWWLITRALWFDFKDVDAAWYIPMVGIPVACAISPNAIGLQYTSFLQGLWYLSFIGFIVFTCLILYRYLFVNPIHTKELPAIGIIGAPASLLLVTYYFDFVTVDQGNAIFMFFLAASGISFTWIALISIFKVFQRKFDPGFAAYSFPLAIGAVARIVFAEWLQATYQGIESGLLSTLKVEALIELIISTIIMIYLVLGFIIHTVTRLTITDEKTIIKLPKVINYFV